MNPELPQAQPSVESLPLAPSGPEVSVGRVEHEQPRMEQQATAGEPAPQASLPAIPQAAVNVAVPAPSAPPQTMASDAPAIAGDDDLIEKEWVDKLKRIISLTRDDPYERARVIAQLQADYLKKRYNREMGQPKG